MRQRIEATALRNTIANGNAERESEIVPILRRLSRAPPPESTKHAERYNKSALLPRTRPSAYSAVDSNLY